MSFTRAWSSPPCLPEQPLLPPFPEASEPAHRPEPPGNARFSRTITTASEPRKGQGQQVLCLGTGVRGRGTRKRPRTSRKAWTAKEVSQTCEPLVPCTQRTNHCRSPAVSSQPPSASQNPTELEAPTSSREEAGGRVSYTWLWAMGTRQSPRWLQGLVLQAAPPAFLGPPARKGMCHRALPGFDGHHLRSPLPVVSIHPMTA